MAARLARGTSHAVAVPVSWCCLQGGRCWWAEAAGWFTYSHAAGTWAENERQRWMPHAADCVCGLRGRMPKRIMGLDP